jgi:alkylation response protein AidB-like acyl-CoA dehydrogenase
MASHTQTKKTTDHDEIRRWVEEHGGRPAAVRGTGDDGDPGMLRIDFPGGAGEESLEPVSWDEWFRKFDEKGLALLYQDRTAGGEDSTFFKLVSRDGDS